MAIMVNASFTKLLKLSAPHRSRPALDARSAVISPPANLTGITSPREPGGSDAPMLQRDGKCIAPGTCSEMPAPQEEVRCWIGTAGRGSDAPMLQRDGKCIAPGTCSEMPAPQEEVRCWIGTAGRGSGAPMLQRDGKCIAPGTCSEMPAPQEEVRCWIGTAGRGLSDVCTTLIIENGARAAGSVPNRGALRKRVMWAT